MDFWRTVVVLFKRWYITVPAFVLTLLVAGAAYSAAPIQYESTSVVALTSPLSGGTKTTNLPPNAPASLTNPLLNFEHSLALTASIVIEQLNSSATTSSLGITPGSSTTCEINNGTTNPELLESGPLIFITCDASSAKEAKAIAEKVSVTAGQILDQRQAELNAPPSTHIKMQMVVTPVDGRPLLSSHMRAAAAVGALSCLASLAAVYGFESLMTNRRRRREERNRSTGTTADDALAEWSADSEARDSLHLVHKR
jgi:hypothetical protein